MSPTSNTPSVHHIELDDYEVANLQVALAFLSHVGGDTGDWHAQVLHKLVMCDAQTAPNKSVYEQRRALAELVGWRLIYD